MAIGGSTLRHSNKRGAKRNLKKSKNGIHNQPNCGLLLATVQLKASLSDKYARCCKQTNVKAIGGSTLQHSNKRGAKRNLKKSKNGIHNQPNCGLLLETVQLKASLWTSMQDVACSQLWWQLADQHFDTQTSEARKETWKSPKMEFTINQTVAYCWQLCN